MSVNRNRAKINKAHNNREYNILMKGDGVDCVICSRRLGVFDAPCFPIWWKKKIKNWKESRETQYKPK